MALSLEGEGKSTPAGGNGVDFDLSRVRLNETQKWCYHEGSYGHNPEYGNTHTLTWSKDGRKGEPPYSGDHLKAPSHEQNGTERAPVASVQTFWKIPHQENTRCAVFNGDDWPFAQSTPSGRRAYSNRGIPADGKEKTTTLSVAALFHQFVKKEV